MVTRLRLLANFTAEAVHGKNVGKFFFFSSKKNQVPMGIFTVAGFRVWNKGRDPNRSREKAMKPPVLEERKHEV